MFMDKNDFYGSVQIAGGTYIGYQALKHGLPRAFGIRIEYHTTSKQNAKLIKASGNILDPSCGGKNGWGQKVNSTRFINNSQNFVHITGAHKDNKLFKNSFFSEFNFLKAPVRTIGRKIDCLTYQIVGNGHYDKFRFKRKSKTQTILKKAEILLQEKFYSLFHNKTKQFCIAGIDSYFNNEFIPDMHDSFALKSKKSVKVYNNRFSAMIGGLKKFGLKGIKENKSRALVGVGVVAGGVYVGGKLINKGRKIFSK